MPRPELTPEKKAEIRRNIRAAAAAVYSREGIAGLSVRMVAKEAGVSVGTIYSHFGSGQALMESLWSGPVERLEEQLRSIAQQVENPVQRIRDLMDAYLQFAIANPSIYHNVFLFVRPMDKPAPNRTPAEEAALPDLVAAAIEAGQQQGLIKSGDATDYAMMLWGSLHGCLALPRNFGRLEFPNPDRVSERVIDVMLSALIVDDPSD